MCPSVLVLSTTGLRLLAMPPRGPAPLTTSPMNTSHSRRSAGADGAGRCVSRVTAAVACTELRLPWKARTASRSSRQEPQPLIMCVI